MSDDLSNRSFIFRFNRRIGGVAGWIGIAIALLLIAGGITSLILKEGMKAGLASGFLFSSSPATILIAAIVAIVIGVGIIAAIIIAPSVHKKQTDKLTLDLGEPLKEKAMDDLERSLESARHESARMAEREQLERERARVAALAEQDPEENTEFQPLFAKRRKSLSELDPRTYEEDEIDSDFSPEDAPGDDNTTATPHANTK